MNIAETLYSLALPLKQCPAELCSSSYLLAFSETGKIFTLDSLARAMKEITLPEYFISFVKNNPVSLIMPNIFPTDGDPVIPWVKFRSLGEKDFVSIGERNHIPFGLGTFHNFRYGEPIILVEGNKDVQLIKSIYPNALCTDTSGMNSVLKLVLPKLTNFFILAYDSDEAGQDAVKRDSFYLRKTSMVKVLEHPTIPTLKGQIHIKDSGSYFDYKAKPDGESQLIADLIKSYYISTIKTLLKR